MAGLFDDLIPGAKPGAAGGLFADLIPAKPKTRNPAAVANDLVIEAGNAVAGGVKSVADFVAPGNSVSSFIEDNIIRPGEASQSDAVKFAKAKYAADMEAAGGIGDEIGATLRHAASNPGIALAQAAGSFAVPGAAVKGAGMLASIGRTGVAAERAAVRGGLAGGAVAGAALSGGDAAGTAYELVMRAGGTEDQAAEAARKASVLPAAIGAAGGVIGAERLLAGAGGFKGGMLSRALKTASVEGAQEAVEEGVTQYEGQAAAVPFDPTIDPLKGVAGAATMGAVLGGATGGAVSLLSGDPAKAKKPGVADILGAPDLDKAIDFSLEAVTAPAKKEDKPLGLATGADGLPFEADPRFAGAPILRGGERPAAPVFGSKQQADVYIGEQALFQSHEAVEVAPGRWQVQPTEATRALLVPNTAIPVGETLEGPPVGIARSLTDDEREAYVNQVPLTYRRAMERGLPQPEVTEAIPAGEALELEGIPAGEAAELDVETIQPTDLLTRDEQPYGSKIAASVRAKKEGGAVVPVRGGWVVRLPQDGGDAQSAPFQALSNRGLADPTKKSALPQGEAGGNQGSDNSNIPSQRPMLGDVLRWAQDDKILRRVVDLVPVNVMNVLIGRNVSPDALLRDKAMLKGALAAAVDNPVPVGVQVAADRVMRAVAGVAAEFGSPGANPVSGPGKTGAALNAGEGFVGRGGSAVALVGAEKAPRLGGGDAAGGAAESRAANTTLDGRQVNSPTRIDELGPSSGATNDGPPTVRASSNSDKFQAGDRVQLNGTPYTVTSANNTAVKLQGADGATKMVAKGSKTYGQIQREPNEAARPQPEAQRAEAAAPAAAPAPAAPAVVPGTGGAAVQADGVKPRKTLQEARADAALDKQVRENGELMTRRQWVERKVAEGLKTKVTQEDRIKPMSRMAYFRANNEEQRAHDRKVKEAGKKDVYWIGDYEVTKTEHDYANALAATPNAEAPVQAAPRGAEAAPVAPAPDADDYLTQLFGTPAEQAASQERLMAGIAQRKQDTERIRDAIGAEKKRAQGEYDDWSSRTYKRNKAQVDLQGDGPSNQGSMSIGAINESRRRNAMEALTQELKALDKLGAAVATDSGAEQFMGAMRDLYARAEKIAADGNGLFKTPGAQFQYMLLDDLKFRGPAGKGNVTSNGLSKAVLSAVKPEAAPAERTPKAQAVKEALAATHKDPGEPAEPVTPAVVREAIKTGVQDTGRKPSAMKAELLAKIDAAMEAASSDEADERQLALARYPARKPTKDEVRTYMVQNRLNSLAAAEEKMVAERERSARNNAAAVAERIGYVTFSVPGDGVFKVVNTRDRLAEFRRKVEGSGGFKDRQSAPAPDRDGSEKGSGSKLAAFDNMVNEGDLEAASDYADAVGLELDPKKIANATKVLKWRETRTTEPAPAPAAEAPAAAPAPAADDRVLTIESGGSTQTLTLPKPAWQATDDELVQAVKDSGTYLGKPGSKYDPYRQWREAHSEAITKAARDGRKFPDELLYDKPALIRTDLNDDQADEASDAMVAEYRATKDYGKAVAVYREWGKKPATPAAQAPAGRDEQPEAQAPAKPAPKSFRKSVKVKTAVFMEETSTFAEQEIDADAAIKALEADIAELQAFRNCIAGG